MSSLYWVCGHIYSGDSFYSNLLWAAVSPLHYICQRKQPLVSIPSRLVMMPLETASFFSPSFECPCVFHSGWKLKWNQACPLLIFIHIILPFLFLFIIFLFFSLFCCFLQLDLVQALSGSTDRNSSCPQHQVCINPYTPSCKN